MTRQFVTLQSSAELFGTLTTHSYVATLVLGAIVRIPPKERR
jgi:hypothetical protein